MCKAKLSNFPSGPSNVTVHVADSLHYRFYDKLLVRNSKFLKLLNPILTSKGPGSGLTAKVLEIPNQGPRFTNCSEDPLSLCDFELSDLTQLKSHSFYTEQVLETPSLTQ